MSEQTEPSSEDIKLVGLLVETRGHSQADNSGDDHESSSTNLDVPNTGEPDAEAHSSDEDIKRIVDNLKKLDSTSIDDSSKNRLFALIDTASDVKKILVLQIALEYNASNLVSKILDQVSVADMCDDKMRRPIHIVIYYHKIKWTKLLVEEKGVSIDDVDSAEQNVLHYAVRSSSIDIAEYLYEHDSCKYMNLLTMCDHHGRTPLKLATEQYKINMVELFLRQVECEETDGATLVLLPDEKNDYYTDTLSTMIVNMPELAIPVLDQLKYQTCPYDGPKSSCKYFLNKLEDPKNVKRSPFKLSVEEGALKILNHPAMKKLVSKKWKWKFFQLFFRFYLFFYVVYLALWTTIIAYPPVQQKHVYDFPTDAWRVILSIVAVLQMGIMIVILLLKAITAFIAAKDLKAGALARLVGDLEVSLSSDEKKALQKQLKKLNTQSGIILNHLSKINWCKKIAAGFSASYFNNYWNISHMIALTLFSLTTILHIADITRHTDQIALWTARLACFGLIFAWARLLMFARASEFFGPMISIIIKLFPHIVKYFVLFLVFYIPYVISFWLMFGGVEQQMAANVTSPELTSFHRVAIVVLHLIYGSSDDYRDIRDIDELMGTILVQSFLLITAIIGLNLFIALLSDTFQRIYDNAQVNALYQKARLILLLEEFPCIGPKILKLFQTHLKNKYSPFTESDDAVGEIEFDEIGEDVAGEGPMDNLAAGGPMDDDSDSDDSSCYDVDTHARKPIVYVQKYVEIEGSKRVLKFVRA